MSSRVDQILKGIDSNNDGKVSASEIVEFIGGWTQNILQPASAAVMMGLGIMAVAYSILHMLAQMSFIPEGESFANAWPIGLLAGGGWAIWEMATKRTSAFSDQYESGYEKGKAEGLRVNEIALGQAQVQVERLTAELQKRNSPMQGKTSNEDTSDNGLTWTQEEQFADMEAMVRVLYLENGSIARDKMAALGINRKRWEYAINELEYLEVIDENRNRAMMSAADAAIAIADDKSRKILRNEKGMTSR